MSGNFFRYSSRVTLNIDTFLVDIGALSVLFEFIHLLTWVLMTRSFMARTIWLFEA